MSWFETKATFEKEINQSGKMKKVTELYLIDAETFTDAEAKLAEIMQGRGAYIAQAVRKVKYYDVFMDNKSERFYKSKVGFISLDERAGMEKNKYVQMLVQADDIEEALEGIKKGMSDTMSDYEIASIAETAYMDVVPYLIKA